MTIIRAAKIIAHVLQAAEKKYRSPDGVTVGIRDWYNSVVHISSKNKFKVLDCAAKSLRNGKGIPTKK